MASVSPENNGLVQGEMDYKSGMRKRTIISVVLGLFLAVVLTAFITILVIYLKGENIKERENSGYEVNACDNHDCQNGNCMADKSRTRGYMCNCTLGYVGHNCEADACNITYCNNGGSCEADLARVRGYKCRCNIGYVGENCEVKVCENGECQNGGTCEKDQYRVKGYVCSCAPGYIGYDCEVLPKDCKDLHENGQTNSDVYNIYPYGDIYTPAPVYCDMDTMGGGWTVIQKRISDAVSFDRDWQTYGEGFGSPDGNLWIGNEMIHELTKDKKTSLYISITTDGLPLYVLYEEFSVANAENKYKLFLRGSVEGTLGDKMLYLDQVESGYILSGMSFSTSDADNDLWQNGHCAVVHKGGWWYNNCHYAFLNGPWASATWDNPWKDKIENGADVTETKMMIKRA